MAKPSLAERMEERRRAQRTPLEVELDNAREALERVRDATPRSPELEQAFELAICLGEEVLQLWFETEQLRERVLALELEVLS